MDTRTRTAPSPRRRRFAGAALLAAGGAVILVGLAFPAGAAADPKGNNGTVKIDGFVLQAGQSNEPHTDCRFTVEFSGYDKGDLKASVTFALQAPTRRPSGSQVLLTDTVAIGEDPAGGAVDLDASREYQLDFTGVAPHPQQGYHVKATVHAEGSQGADTKYKVFWVQPCASTTTTTTTTTTITTTSTPTTTVTTGTPTTPTTVTVEGSQTTATTVGVQVLGEQVERTDLPRTGTALNRLSLLGALALTLGGLILLLCRAPSATTTV